MAAISHTLPRVAAPRIGLLFLVGAAFLVAYAPVISTLVGQWRANNEYSHGFLIPWMSLYLVWARRERLAAAGAAPSPVLGWPVTAAGLAMLLVGQAGGIAALASISLIVTLTGVVLVLFGPRVLRIASLPIAFLIFMIPVWGSLTERLHVPFQLLAANSAVALLQAVGVPAYRAGVLIELPGVTLEVARACSGVNYLVAVAALAIMVAQLYLRDWWRRAVLLAGALAVGAASNGLRVAIIGLLAHAGFEGPLHGPGHVLQAMSVSAAGYVAIFAGLWALAPQQREERSARPRVDLVRPAEPRIGSAGLPRVAVVLCCVLLVAAGYQQLAATSAVQLPAGLDGLPTRIGRWALVAGAGEGATPVRAPGADVELLRTYGAEGGESVTLYVAYFAAQRQGKEVVSYQTDALHARTEPARLVWPGAGVVEANRFVSETPQGPVTGVFWYVVGDRILADRLWAKLRTAWDGLVWRRTHGALVVVTAAVPPGDETRAFESAEGFARDVAPYLATYLAQH